MNLQKLFGTILTLLGIIMLILAGIAALQGGLNVLGLVISQWEALVPFILGVIFFSSGIKLINATSGVK